MAKVVRGAALTALGSMLVALACDGDFAPVGAGECLPGDERSCYSGPSGTEGIGACVGGTQTCGEDGRWGGCEGEVVPEEEDCATAEDDDCDGEANEDGDGCVCAPGDVRECYSGPEGTLGVGRCRGGESTCGELGDGWGACEGEVVPEEEDCDSLGDEDCDGVACSDPLVTALYGAESGEVGRAIAFANGAAFLAVEVEAGLEAGGEVISGAGAGLFRMGLDGEAAWAVKLTADGPIGVAALAPLPGGGVVVAGQAQGGTAISGPTGPIVAQGLHDGFIARYEPSGAHSLLVGASGAVTPAVAPDLYRHLEDIAVQPNGVLVAVGRFTGHWGCAVSPCLGASDGYAMFVSRYDADSGVLLSRKVFDGPGHQAASSVAAAKNGALAVAGTFSGALDLGSGKEIATAKPMAGFVALLDAAGDPLWLQRIDGAMPYDVVPPRVAVGPNGEVVVAGSFREDIAFDAGSRTPSAGGVDAFIAVYRADGELLEAATYGEGGDQAVYALAVDGSGDVVVAGELGGAADFGGGVLDADGTAMFVAKLATAGLTHRWSKVFDGASAGSYEALHGVAIGPNGVVGAIGTASAAIDLGLGPLPFGGATDIAFAIFNP